MAASTVNGSGNGAHSGAQTLLLLAAPLNVIALRALTAGPRQQADLRRETGSPPQTTLRAQLKRLVEIGAIVKHRRNRFPGTLEYELTGPGHDLLFVAEVLDGWLADAPDGRLALGNGAARAATKALVEGWSTTMLRALAARPLSLTELDRLIGGLSYPSLERRLAAMRLAGQVEARLGNSRGTPYAVTDWLRHGIAPLLAATRWERRHMAATTAPVGRLDVEATFLLTAPLLRPPVEMHGSCRLAVGVSNGGKRRLAGITAMAENGAITACTVQLKGKPDAWALGAPAAWLSALIEADSAQLELGGDCGLARTLLDGLHEALFATGPARSYS